MDHIYKIDFNLYKQTEKITKNNICQKNCSNNRMRENILWKIKNMWKRRKIINKV